MKKSTAICKRYTVQLIIILNSRQKNFKPFQGAPSDINEINQRFYDLERQNDRKSKDKVSHEDRIENLEKDMDHIMGRAETSNVSGVPTMVIMVFQIFNFAFYVYVKYLNQIINLIIILFYQNRLLSDIDECKTITKKVDDALEKTKGEIDEKFEKEIKEVR